MKNRIPLVIGLTMTGIILVLTVASLTGQYYKAFIGADELILKVVDKFDLDLEKNNVPTWYQSSTLLLSALLLWLIAYSRRGLTEARYWLALGCIFLFLSVDEAVSIHEQLTMPLRTAFDLKGVLYLSWVIPAGAILVFLAGVFFRFLKGLPGVTRNLMATAAIAYLAGALGVEMVGANYLSVTNDLPTRVTDFTYVLITTAEEFLEMLGVMLFICALTYELNPVFASITRIQGEEDEVTEAGRDSVWKDDLEYGLSPRPRGAE